MESISFDRAAEYYDSTRGFAEGVAERVRDAIVSFTGASKDTRFLELGVGTGRIGLPFIQAGYDYTGIDISQEMMAKLREKIGKDAGATNYRYRLLQGDITHLPFEDNEFGVAIMVHVLHLVGGWQEALREARRVMVNPGGQLVIGNDTPGRREAEGDSRVHNVNQQWDEILTGLGVDVKNLRPGLAWGSEEKLENFLRELGAEVQLVDLLEYERPPLSPREMAERHRAKMYSADWLVTNETHAEAIRQIEKWLDEECPAPDRPETSTGKFKALVAKWT
jgi:SAM-dependent methyltransferase